MQVVEIITGLFNGMIPLFVMVFIIGIFVQFLFSNQLKKFFGITNDLSTDPSSMNEEKIGKNIKEEKVIRECYQCGSPFSDEDTFCGQCGYKL